MSGLGGYDPGHYAPIVEAERRHFWFQARNAVLETVVRQEIAGLAPGYSVLEAGCGSGHVLAMLHRVCGAGRVVGMDFLIEGLRVAHTASAAALVQGRVEQPPFSRPFDLVGIFDTLEHVDDDRAALRHLRGLVKPNGVLVLTVPAYQALWSDFDEEAHHCRRYEPSDLRARLNAAGFKVEYLTPFMAALYPVARLGRAASDLRRGVLRRHGSAAESAVSEQLRVRPGVNGLLAFILGQEARLVARRMSIPIGTSLLAVARAPAMGPDNGLQLSHL